MSISCDKCGRVTKENEAMVSFVDPASEWWLTLWDVPKYCLKCGEGIKATCKVIKKVVELRYET